MLVKTPLPIAAALVFVSAMTAETATSLAWTLAESNAVHAKNISFATPQNIAQCNSELKKYPIYSTSKPFKPDSRATCLRLRQLFWSGETNPKVLGLSLNSSKSTPFGGTQEVTLICILEQAASGVTVQMVELKHFTNNGDISTCTAGDSNRPVVPGGPAKR
jgi:hypothetical protein